MAGVEAWRTTGRCAVGPSARRARGPRSRMDRLEWAVLYVGRWALGGRVCERLVCDGGEGELARVG